MPKLRNIEGAQFGQWTVGSRVGSDKHHGARWNCTCSCGTQRVVSAHTLTRGTSQSCGCVWRQKEGRRRYFPPGVVNARWRYSSYQTQARTKGHRFSLTWDEFKALIEAPCYFCGAPPAHRYACRGGSDGLVGNGVDRFCNSEGYTSENCVSCCQRCNFLKGARDGDDFIAVCCAIAANQDARTEAAGCQKRERLSG